MTVSISKMNIEYYLSTTAKSDGQMKEVKDLTSYYLDSQTPAGRWIGSGLTGLSLNHGDQVSKHDARKIYEQLVDPITGARLGRRPIKTVQAPLDAKTPQGKKAKEERNAVAGFDLTFSVPKSVSVLWALADVPTQGRLYAAHQAAIDQTLAWLEREVIQTRAGHNGVAHVQTKGVVGSLFDHWDSRAGDPQLHTHAVLLNRVQRADDGQWTTLDSYTLHRHVVAASEMYNGLLFDEVYRQTGAVAELRDGNVEVRTVADDSGQKVLVDQEAVEDGINISVELRGVPDELLLEFSTRSKDIEAFTDFMISDYEEEYGHRPTAETILEFRQKATLATRQAKSKENHPLNFKMFQWQQRTFDAGFDANQVIAQALGLQTEQIAPSMLQPETIAELGSIVLRATSARRTTFTKANVLATTQRLLMTVRCASPEDRASIVDSVVDFALDEAVQLSPNRFGAIAADEVHLTRNGHSIFDQPESWLYSTQELLDKETYLRKVIQESPGPSLQDTEELRTLLDTVEVGDGYAMAKDQAQAAHEVVTSTQLVNAIIGPAGTGKTTTMRGIKAAWDQKYGEGSVIGLAPSAVAAEVLGHEIKSPTENVAKWIHETTGPGAQRRAHRYAELKERLEQLLHQQKQNPKSSALDKKIHATNVKITELLTQQSKYQLRENQLLILDEASMAATGDVAAIVEQAEHAGAKVLMVGDPEQLQSVEAGGILGWMERSELTSHLSSVWRFKADWEGLASLQLRKGDFDAIEAYSQHERITGCDNGTVNDAAYKEWIHATTDGTGTSTILISASNADVLDLNTKAQGDLIALGQVLPGQNVAQLQESEAHIGDVVLARKVERTLTDESGAFIKNGSRVTVEKVNEDGSVEGIHQKSGAKIVLPANYLKAHGQLGYAVTAHRAQGVTVDKAYCVVKENLNRGLLYVGMTRGRHDNQLFVELPEAEEDHSPDPWKMFTPEKNSDFDPDGDDAEREEETRRVIARVMATTDTDELLATEQQDAAHGTANDLPRLVSEYQHVATAINTRHISEIIQEKLGDHALHDLQRSELWPRLVDHWQDSAEHLMDSFKDPAQLVEQLKMLPRAEHQHLHGILPRVRPETAEERRITGLLEEKITDRLAYLTWTAKDASWTKQLRHYPLNEASRAKMTSVITLWRSLSDQEHIETLHEPPELSQRRLWPMYEQLATYLDSLKTDLGSYELDDVQPDFAQDVALVTETAHQGLSVPPMETDMNSPDPETFHAT